MIPYARPLGLMLLCAFLASLVLGCWSKPPPAHAALRPLVCLFTDYGEQDAYVGQLKGAIKNIAINAEVLDLTHEAQAFKLETASYLFGKSAKHFPLGTTFVVAVDSGVGPDKRVIVVRTKAGKTYIAPDNGILTGILDIEKLDKAYAIENTELFLTATPSASFHGRDLFGPVAGQIAEGKDISSVGPEVKDLVRLPISTPTILKSRITAQIVHIDRFGNVITNLRGENAGALPQDKLVKLLTQGKTFSLPLVKNYSQAPQERLSLLINSEGEVEIALREGNAQKIMGAQIGQTIIFQF